MSKKIIEANDALEHCRIAFKKADDEAITTLKSVLEPAGEKGIELFDDAFSEDYYLPVAEVTPRRFEPIKAIRYWKGELEVFIPNFNMAFGHLELHEGGRWVNYEDAMPDTWLILDFVSDNIESAEGYEA